MKLLSSYRLFWIAVITLVGGFSFYSWFSYSLTAPNLILTSWAPYWQWQTWMWKTFFNNREALTLNFLLALGWIWFSYFAVLSTGRTVLQQVWKSPRIAWLLAGVVLLPLLFSMNALSYDVFNYQFNAKMLIEYGANPHVQVALDFPDDPWVRFMHNTHTPAPYGYGWTALSLIPYAAGMGKLLLTWLSFRLWNVLAWIFLGVLLRWLIEKFRLSSWWWWAVMLNPLLLIEAIATQHNDLWMMVPAIASLGWVAVARLAKHQSPFRTISITLLGSLLLLLGSISIKLATIALLPIWLCLAIDLILPSRVLPAIRSLFRPYWPVVAAVALFLPLLSPRSQQFHPWYWMWVLTWLPLFPQQHIQASILGRALFWLTQWLQGTILVISAILLWRYYPYLAAGNFEGSIFSQQLAITWYGIAAAAGVMAVRVFLAAIKYNKSS